MRRGSRACRCSRMARVVIQGGFQVTVRDETARMLHGGQQRGLRERFGGDDTPSVRDGAPDWGRGPFPRESGIRFTGFFSASSVRDVPSMAVQPASMVTSLEADSGTRSMEPSA